MPFSVGFGFVGLLAEFVAAVIAACSSLSELASAELSQIGALANMKYAATALPANYANTHIHCELEKSLTWLGLHTYRRSTKSAKQKDVTARFHF